MFCLTVDNTGQLQFRDEGSVNQTKISISPLNTYRREARLRQSACLLYQSSLLEEVFLKLEVEVETRRLSMRLDQTIYSDVGLRQQLIELLNCYSTPWLRLGIEVCLVLYTIYHGTIHYSKKVLLFMYKCTTWQN